MMRRAPLAAAALAVLCAAATPARAERIVSSLATHQVMITSNFTGLDLILFGSVERDDGTVPRTGGYDLIVTVTGPREALVMRRKERIVGIWVNAQSQSFASVPSYLAVLSSKPLDSITSANTLRRLQLGLMRTFLPPQIDPDVIEVGRDAPFRAALLRLRENRKLYVEQASAVTFLTPTLFRATIPLPAEVRTGTYDVDLALFADGVLVGRATSAFDIIKVGFEQFVASSAVSHGTVYGLITVVMALMTGWFASVVFRKD